MGLPHLLRLDIIWLHLVHKVSQAQIAKQYKIHFNTVYRIIAIYLENGCTSNKNQ